MLHDICHRDHGYAVATGSIFRVTHEELLKPTQKFTLKPPPLVPSETPALTSLEVAAMTPVDLSLRVFCGYVFEELEYNEKEDVIRVSLRGIAPNSEPFTLNVTAAHHANLIDSTGGLSLYARDDMYDRIYYDSLCIKTRIFLESSGEIDRIRW